MSTVRVAAISAQGPLSPAYRVRTSIPRRALEGLGVLTESATLFSEEDEIQFRVGTPLVKAQVLLRARRRLAARLSALRGHTDTAWIQRQADMLPTLRLERAAAQGLRLVADVDDAIWLDTSAAAGGHPLAVVKGTRRKIRWLARRADHVVAGNEFLAEWVGQHARAVTIVPSLVDPERLPVRSHEARETVVLGWIGSRSTARHLESIREPLAQLVSATPDLTFELAVMGGEIQHIPGLVQTTMAWSESGERELLGRMDVGLMPLPDNPWTRGKCAYKALQYMSAGIPVIADDVGISARVIGDGEAGLVVRGPDEWTEGIRELGRDPVLREQLGAAGRRRVEAEFSVDRWAPTLAAILRGDAVPE